MGEWVKHGMSAHAIYEYFSTGRGTDMLDEAQQATYAELRMETTRAWMITKQGELIRGGWEGTASDGAYGAAAPLAKYASDGVDLLGRAQDLLDRQSGSYHRAANSVTPVPEEPPAIDLSDPMVVFTDYDAQIKEYQSQTHHNFDVYGVYDGASEYNQTNMPGEYSTINHAGGSNITVTDKKPSDTGDYIEVPEREQPRNGGESGPYGGPSGPGPGGSPVSGPPPVSGPVPNPSQPQQTSPSTHVPPAINTPGQFPSGQTPYQPTPGANPPGYVSGLPVGYGPGSSPGARGGGFGPRGGGGPGGGYGGGQGGNPGAGARGAMPGPGGAAAGALAAEEAAARRAAAAAAAARGGAAGGMGGAPLGGGRGQGEEDEEHKRKVLIETDAESVFGSDVLTAPQVIGDDEYEDD